ncbi:hypothetical protein OO013_08580 [Mangrovivirga sp. M17]|uniref:Uncharacterized protein n=1 Tax=Mangrovivirga halotolerans TaxID=2993936 RepID=A0ABT3RRB0_9BACT|nr:hypothetical protein [Mangrovivirga halotolerans]MCX2743919.1 hypothetical protein [Mangrovivirga halotolerans]
MESITIKAPPEVSVTSKRKSQSIPVYAYATVISSISIMIGLVWDISWHTSIGRDGLLSPPHLAIYFGGILAGVFSGIRVLKTSFWGNDHEKSKSLKFWGIFYGSLGALFCIWGAFAMLTSAPFDDWWHNTYGLDVTILSPPHTVLLLGMVTIQFGAMVSVLAVNNRARQIEDYSNKRKANILFAISSGFLVCMIFTILSEFFGRHDMHKASFYQVASMAVPLLLVAFSRSAPSKWGATQATLVYTVFMAAMVWILPLFPAEPLLGPVLNPITHYQAFAFPLLLLFPAVAIDIINQRTRNKNNWLKSIYFSVAFVAVLFIVQYPFGDFLMSEYARNWFFGTESWYFGSNPDWEFRYSYADYMETKGLDLLIGLLIAIGLGLVSSRIGLRWGKWMNNIKR